MNTFLSSMLVLAAAIGLNNTAYGAQCTKDDLNRVVSTVYSEPGQPTPCEVLYEKPSEGESMTLWRAQNQAGYCEARAAEFIEKLAELGWSCSSPRVQKEKATEEEASQTDSAESES